MKPSRILKIAALALPLVLVACGTKKKAVVETKPVTPATMSAQKFLQKVNDNAQYAKFITSKVKFSVEVGNQQLTLTGNLKMKRDDVIRLQLMAFGFVEAGRLEFTKDYVLIMDRINKQFIKANYNQLDFLRNSGLNFYSLQALFWNELFQPGKSKVSDELLNAYETDLIGEDAIISMENGKLSYRWLADKDGALIKMANIMYEDKIRGNYQLNWDYEDFRTTGKKQFPYTHKILFNTPDKSVKMGMNLNYLGNDDEWETRTEISGKYREVTVDEILRRFMAL
ncbi:MAG: DUF4292 domain-containing protein [Prevotella sp.]|jgi:hypothetical protein|nr:DUF4292 domain-containing protein [Prevotella sp.]